MSPWNKVSKDDRRIDNVADVGTKSSFVAYRELSTPLVRPRFLTKSHAMPLLFVAREFLFTSASRSGLFNLFFLPDTLFPETYRFTRLDLRVRTYSQLFAFHARMFREFRAFFNFITTQRNMNFH